MDGEVHSLIAGLADSREEVRIWAARCLGAFGTRSEPAIDRLIDVLDDPSPGVCFEAASTLGKVGSVAARALPEMIRLMRRHDRTAEAIEYAAPEVFEGMFPTLGGYTQEVTELLAAALGDPSERTRYAAAYGLRLLGGLARPAVSRLVEALGDESSQVRFWAAISLKEIGKIDSCNIIKITQFYTVDDEVTDGYIAEILAVAARDDGEVERYLENYRLSDHPVYKEYFRLLEESR